MMNVVACESGKTQLTFAEGKESGAKRRWIDDPWEELWKGVWMDGIRIPVTTVLEEEVP